ncbi:indole-3-glycerol phosphate synthase TrpC [Lysinibacter sp. HNR]|uniref:indole-3-glycerol phosphate synthase TrpC n=1 Tax=Lysinibacter sp. HNR TaxID=3031408 RepID=UPI002435C875|nr:indole-3-glycerol phosphate synthase TrpC [Lysinibacter sp. HNR]WGD36353.1 indole-3-glycerol phosphate synthase TrpC [Lysinibacter sp. HNR]
MLESLMAAAREDAAVRRETRPFNRVEADALAQDPARDAIAFLRPEDTVKIIAEIKRASPSRGVLADIPDPAALASLYETGGASAVSVLTEGRKFGGSLADLEAVREAVSLPVLRKDFISNPYQVFEARASGADMVLLIVAALDQKQLTSLYNLSAELGMATLVETHSADEVSRAIDIGANLVGVNARNLSTFELDNSLFGRLADQIPAGVIRVAESAVHSAEDVARYRRDGADVVLVGEALVTGDPLATLAHFLAV